MGNYEVMELIEILVRNLSVMFQLLITSLFSFSHKQVLDLASSRTHIWLKWMKMAVLSKVDICIFL